jgi:hypothetical protein
MAELEHISFFVKQLINDIENNYLNSYCCEILKAIKLETLRELKLSEIETDPIWQYNNECIKEQIMEIMIDCEIELLNVIKEIEDLQRAK